ncbi:MAG: GTPase Era [bacterium]
MKSGFVTIVGRPNVGKSTILNKIIGKQITAISHKPQTTRHKILGILNGTDYQVIFMDTPGIFKPMYTMQRLMVKSALATLKETDVVLLVVEPFYLELDLLTQIEKPTVLAINKIDLLRDKTEVLPLVDKYKDYPMIKEIVPLSAFYNDGLAKLRDSVISYLPEGEPYYPEDFISDRPNRFFVTEIIKEHIFLLYGEEIPYAATAVVEEFKEREKGKFYISVTIYVERDSEKMIILGADGRAIKKLGTASRRSIEKFLDHEVYLELWVKVKKQWRKDPIALREFGYE